MKKVLVTVASVFCAVVALADAAFSVDNIFGDGMVMQRRKPVRVSGNAEPSLSVTATFRGEKRVAVAGADGRWTVEFPAGEAGGPFEMKFVPGWEKGRSFVFTDILVGDVWVCSGQSNMSFPVWEGGHRFFRLPEGAKLARSAKDRRLRLFNGCRSIAVDGPCTDMTGRPRWMPADSYDAIAPFSAVGYLFGAKLRKALEDDIPIGMVHASWGGSMIEPWIPESAYARAGRTDVTTALAAYRAVGCRGVARVDFRVSPLGRAYVLELNTSPGFTSHSLVPKAGMKTGLSFAGVCDAILRCAALDR